MVSEEVEKAGRRVVVADGRRVPADQRGEMIATERHVTRDVETNHNPATVLQERGGKPRDRLRRALKNN